MSIRQNVVKSAAVLLMANPLQRLPCNQTPLRNDNRDGLGAIVERVRLRERRILPVLHKRPVDLVRLAEVHTAPLWRQRFGLVEVPAGACRFAVACSVSRGFARSSVGEQPALPDGRGFESHRVIHANSSVEEQKIFNLRVVGSNPSTQMACYAMQR